MKLSETHSDMIDVLYFIKEKNWLISIGRDYNLIIWKLMGAHLVEYVVDVGEDCSISNSESELQPVSPDEKMNSKYLLKYQTTHKDFVRSVIHNIGKNTNNNKQVVVLVTASEDKSLKFLLITN